jgi:hypothetical protein
MMESSYDIQIKISNDLFKIACIIASVILYTGLELFPATFTLIVASLIMNEGRLNNDSERHIIVLIISSYIAHGFIIGSVLSLVISGVILVKSYNKQKNIEKIENQIKIAEDKKQLIIKDNAKSAIKIINELVKYKHFAKKSQLTKEIITVFEKMALRGG